MQYCLFDQYIIHRFSSGILKFKHQAPKCYFKKNQYFLINILLNIQILQYLISIGMSNCEECRNKQKQYKILKSDLQFQIKRTKEDLAQEKVVLELNFQKEYKKVMQKYNKEKQEREQQNKKWIGKYDNMVLFYEHKIQLLNKQWENQCNKLKEQLTTDHTKREQDILVKFQTEKQQFSTIYNQELQDLKKHQTQTLLQLKTKNEEIVNTINKTHHSLIEQIVSQNQNKIKYLKNEIEELSKNCDNMKIQAKTKQTSLYQEIYERKQEISNLKYQISSLNNNIKEYQEEIIFKNKEIVLLNQKHKETISILKKQFQCQNTKIIQDYNKQIQSILLKKLQDCQKFEQNVKDIQQKRQSSLKIYETCLQQVKDLVSDRPSRQEDVEQILVLKDMLNRKEKQFQQVLQEAKTYKLELNYKDQTFKRIFSATTNPLKIEKIADKKKDNKYSRGSSFIRDINKYTSVNTLQNLNSTECEFKKQKRLQLKSNKFF